VFSAEIGEKETVFPMDVGTLWWSSSIFALPSVPRVEERGKAYCAFPVGAQSEQLFDRHAVSVPFVSLPRATWSEENLELARVSTAYYGQVELALALGGGFRVGTNVFEWVDFACGWFGIDPLADDMGGDVFKGDEVRRPVLRVPDSDRVGK
jgi:hypothetical protein